MAAIFLDLDGTLMDSKPGILSSLGHAFRETGHGALAENDLTWMIGPPFVDSFARLGLPDHEPVLEAYRRHYRAEGMFVATVFPDVFEALDAFQAAGHDLYLATAKPHDYATKITAHFGLATYMTAEFGPELDGTRGQKADLLAHALEVTGVAPDQAVMVGDRDHDFHAARANGMPAIGVGWGYGSAEELARADQVLGQTAAFADGVLAHLSARGI